MNNLYKFVYIVIVQDSFNISSIIDGAALYYVMNFIDSNPRVCKSSNISASSCDENGFCTVSPVDLTGCSQDGKINLSVSAFNLLGGGQATNFSIGTCIIKNYNSYKLNIYDFWSSDVHYSRWYQSVFWCDFWINSESSLQFSSWSARKSIPEK